jgi:adenylate kinase family enzyme
MNILLFGPQGSGKGTQGKMLERAFGTPHLASGDILRAEIAAQTPLGCEVKAVMERGELVRDVLITDMMLDFLEKQRGARGFVLDGFPRTVVQAEALEVRLNQRQQALAAAISFDINLPAIKKGLEAEIEIPGRLETIQAGQPFTVVVDYAHTAESLDKLLGLFKPLTKGKLFLVFGATGGGRDKAKRPKMGEKKARDSGKFAIADRPLNSRFHWQRKATAF